MSLILVCFPGCSGGEGRKEGKRGNIGCERGERLADGVCGETASAFVLTLGMER